MAEVKEITRKLEEIHNKIKAEIPWEPMGPTPMPEIPDLRQWDMRLLKTYAPFYAPFCDLCCFCTYGKCDLTEGRRGACGIDIATQQARFVLMACLMGCSAHAAHGGHILEFLYIWDEFNLSYFIARTWILVILPINLSSIPSSHLFFPPNE